MRDSPGGYASGLDDGCGADVSTYCVQYVLVALVLMQLSLVFMLLSFCDRLCVAFPFRWVSTTRTRTCGVQADSAFTSLYKPAPLLFAQRVSTSCGLAARVNRAVGTTEYLTSLRPCFVSKKESVSFDLEGSSVIADLCGLRRTEYRRKRIRRWRARLGYTPVMEWNKVPHETFDGQ